MDTTNDEIREMIRRIYCMNFNKFCELTGFENDYASEKWRKLQNNPALALVDSFDEQRSNAIMNWALRK